MDEMISRHAQSEEFVPLLVARHALDAAFLRHQALLVRGETAEAEAALRSLRGLLAGHMEGEERVILPFYAGHVKAPKGGRVEYFRAEHVKLMRLLAEAAAWMEAWRGLSSGRSARAIRRATP